MKTLLITSKPPYPIIDGGCYATSKLIECLIYADINFDLFCLSTEKHPFSLKDIPESVTSHSKVYHSIINTQVTVWGALKSLFSGESYNVNRFDHHHTHNELIEVLNNGYTHVIFDSLYSTPYLQTVIQQGGIKSFVRTHNVEHLIWSQNGESESNFIKRAFSKNLSQKLKAYELATLKKFHGVFSISKDDTEVFKKLEIQSKIYDIPVSLNVENLDVDYENKRVFHLGSMNWKPNVDAVNTLIGLWSKIRAKIPKAELHIAGSAMDGWNQPEQNGVIIDGFVSDIKKYATQNGILVSPITSGSGVKIKILEMLAFGIPVITTTMGAEGLQQDSMLVIANNEDELIIAIESVINSPSEKRRMGERGKKYIDEFHNVEIIGQKIRLALSE